MVYVLRLIDNTLVSHPRGLLCQIQAKNNVEHLMSGTNSSLNAARVIQAWQKLLWHPKKKYHIKNIFYQEFEIKADRNLPEIQLIEK